MALVATAVLGACDVDDGEDEEVKAPRDSGCPVEPGQVAELVGYEVVVVEDAASTVACRFEPADPGDTDPGTDEPSRAGAHVLVVERRIAAGGYRAVRDAVEVDVGPTEALADVVEGGAGWVARVGRVVQVGVARDRRLVQVTVADPALDAAAASDIAVELAVEALG